MLQPCLTVLGMDPVDQSGQITEKTMFKSRLLHGKCSRSFYAYQVTGACFMLMRLMGTIPLPAANANDPEVKAALDELQGLRTYGCILADATGLGKTVETLLAMAFIRLFSGELSENGKYKPFLLIVPANAINQWAEEIEKFWPCFILAISYAREDLKAAFQDHAISASTMKELPGSYAGLNKTKKSTRDYSHLFNGTAKNGNTIILTSHDTQSSRFVDPHIIEHAAESYTPPKYDDEDREIFKKAAWQEREWRTRMGGRFFLTVVDEAHEIKNPSTKNWAAVYLAASGLTILITATPMQNNSAVSRPPHGY